MNQFRSSRCKNAACNKIPSCGSRVLNTFVFLRQRCTWPAPVIPQVFGTSVSDKSPAPGRLPALFSLRQSFRATSTEPPPRFVDSFLRPHFHPRFFLFLLLPFLFLFFPFLLLLSLSLFLCTFYIPQRIDSWLQDPETIRRPEVSANCSALQRRWRSMDKRRGKNFGEIWRTLCLWKGTTRSGIEFWLFGYGIRRRRIVSETRVTGLWRIADGRWARPIKLIIHLLQPGGKFKLVLKNSPANGLAKRIGFSKLTTPVKLDGRGPTPSTPRILGGDHQD